MKAGTGRRNITPPLGIDLAGFAESDRKADGIYDDFMLPLCTGIEKIILGRAAEMMK